MECRIESLAAGGDGVAHLPDGRVLFVPFAAPGDRLRVRLVEEHPRYARGEILALIAPGESRTEPACPAFGSCGGCAWQHLRYADQVEAKRRILRDALRRIGGLDFPAEIPVTPSPTPYRYRSRARVQVEGSRVGYRRRRSHRLCAVAACPVLVEDLEAKLAELAGDPPAPGEWELAVGDAGPPRALRLRPGAQGAGASRTLAYRVAGETLRVSPGVFAQAHAALRGPLADAVVAAATAGGRPAEEHLLELYSGAGFLTLPLARRFRRVTAVESNPRAARDLSAHAHAHAHAGAHAGGLDRLEVRCARVEDAVVAPDLERPDVVALDPPRAGLPPGAAAPLAALGARRIAYLSCDPATLARDLAALARAGYRLARVEGFDLFPQTPHLEALAVLDRLPGATRV